MERIKLKYTRHELWRYSKDAAKSLLAGFARIAWAIMLLSVNLALWARERVVSAIRSYPCASVGVTFAAMLFAVAFTHMQMKVRLTTAEWQRDSIGMRYDSVATLYNVNKGYTKMQPYKE